MRWRMCFCPGSRMFKSCSAYTRCEAVKMTTSQRFPTCSMNRCNPWQGSRHQHSQALPQQARHSSIAEQYGIGMLCKRVCVHSVFMQWKRRN
jgi:hypothetical protein